MGNRSNALFIRKQLIIKNLNSNVKKFIKVSVYILSVSWLFFLIPGCSPTLEDKLRSYEQAHNNHDIEKIISMYSNDARFEIVGSWIRSGKEEILGLAEWDSVTNSRMIITDIKTIGDTVTFKLQEGNDWFRLAGIEYMYYEPCRIVFRNGLITELKAETTAESLGLFMEIWPGVFKWLSAEKGDELSALISGGEFVYNRENAEKWLTLLREWKEHTNN